MLEPLEVRASDTDNIEALQAWIQSYYINARDNELRYKFNQAISIQGSAQAEHDVLAFAKYIDDIVKNFWYFDTPWGLGLLHKGKNPNGNTGDLLLLKPGERGYDLVTESLYDDDSIYTVIGHGYPDTIFNNGKLVDPVAFANYISNRIDYGTNSMLVLYSCNTGLLPDGFAQKLANELNFPVLAPNGYYAPANNMIYKPLPGDNGYHGQFDPTNPGNMIYFPPKN